jgi:propanol-preferring alcohol dehydrogenase
MKMRAAHVTRPKGPLEIVEREIPEPGTGQVRVKVDACGICHSDSVTTWPGIQYPHVPGHEIAGTIDAIGGGVAGWTKGQRVGIGWHGGHCRYCDSCPRGNFVTCQIAPQVPGIAYDGGYAEFVIVPAGALAPIPEGFSAVEARPLMCAGVTTFNPLRNSGARPGDLVAILGIGGPGHLGVQFAAKMGFRTVAIARGMDKEPLAKKLGARSYIDSKTQDPAAELLKLGGVKVVLATVTNGDAMSATLGGLGVNGKLIILGAAAEPLQVPGFPFILGRRSILGWPLGQLHRFAGYTSVQQSNRRPRDNRSLSTGARGRGYEHMMSGKARFRAVLTIGH